MCEHLGRCSVPGAYNTSAGSAEPLTSRPNERMRGGQGELDLNLSRRNGKRQSGRNQATGRTLQVGQLDSRTGLGCLTPPPMNRHRSTRKARKKMPEKKNPTFPKIGSEKTRISTCPRYTTSPIIGPSSPLGTGSFYVLGPQFLILSP